MCLLPLYKLTTTSSSLLPPPRPPYILSRSISLSLSLSQLSTDLKVVSEILITMKSSPSSWLWGLMLLGLFLASSATQLGQFSNPTTTTHHHHHHPHPHQHRRHRSCSSAASSSSSTEQAEQAEQAPSSLCIQIRRIRSHLPPLLPPPPPSSSDEIDPRYGVEKRLVPSGPNPLHN